MVPGVSSIRNLKPNLFHSNTRAINSFRKHYITQYSTSTSNNEIYHFQKLAPSWWDTWGPQRILHKMNFARLDFIQRTLSNEIKISNSDIYIPGFNYKSHLPKNISETIETEIDQAIRHQLNQKRLDVLDIGCGGGILSESLARLPFVKTVHGIDLTAECIEIAIQHAQNDPLVKKKTCYELKSLDTVDSQYEIITMFEMLEHVDNPNDILRHAWNRLKPEGILFLSTINRDPISWFTTIFMAENILNIVPKGTHHLEKYINSNEISEWFQTNNPTSHQILDLKGTMYLPMKGWIEHTCPRIGNYFMAIKKLK